VKQLVDREAPRTSLESALGELLVEVVPPECHVALVVANGDDEQDASVKQVELLERHFPIFPGVWKEEQNQM